MKVTYHKEKKICISFKKNKKVNGACSSKKKKERKKKKGNVRRCSMFKTWQFLHSNIF